MKKTLGGDRLGTGQKEQIEMHEYGRSTHNMSYPFRTTCSAGTIIPFAVEVMLPGDEWDIDLDMEVLTHPTVGPVFGSMKVQADIFTADMRLYQGKLHNNLTGIGLNMANIKLPTFKIWPEVFTEEEFNNYNGDINNASINPSCILAYLGLSGVGVVVDNTSDTRRNFNGISWLAYWDIYKNYFANQQEKQGAVIHTPAKTRTDAVGSFNAQNPFGALTNIPQQTPGTPAQTFTGTIGTIITLVTIALQPLDEVILITNRGNIPLNELGTVTQHTAGAISIVYNYQRYGIRDFMWWTYADSRGLTAGNIQIARFALGDIDAMREAILSWAPNNAPFNINNSAGAPDEALYPWRFILEGDGQAVNEFKPRKASQEGLGVKTYLSDLFNNWLNTDWIDGVGGINEISRIDTSAGFFEIDALNLGEKLYKTLNRIVISGNTYDDYLDAGYTAKRWSRPEIPVYHGGLIKELAFHEVISQAESPADSGTQPLGTLGGRGKLTSKHKGGHINVKANEISYLMGLVHITPRIDYSQGNRWDLHLKSVADFRLPGLDEIGFQELIVEQFAWWSTNYNSTTNQYEQVSAGKQPAWQNYRTNYPRVYGNFAIENNEMFMTLNRKYRAIKDNNRFIVDDLTTYIDPAKYNSIFADTALDAQNFWLQMAVNIKARRIMSARVIPNL